MACLDTVDGLFDEIIIVDTGSSDGTVALAESRGAKVTHFPWIDDFAAARNDAQHRVSGDWIFWMDADDRIDDTNRRKLSKLLENLPAEPVVFNIKCLHLTDPDTMTSLLVELPRILPNHPELRWRYRVHEQLAFGSHSARLKIQATDVVIRHLGNQNAALRRQKLERNLRLLLMEYRENPADSFVLYYLGHTYLDQEHPAKAIEFFTVGSPEELWPR